MQKDQHNNAQQLIEKGEQKGGPGITALQCEYCGVCTSKKKYFRKRAYASSGIFISKEKI